MGQSPSTPVPSSPDLTRREIFNPTRFGYGDADFPDDSIGRDYTADIPDECLAGIFQFLGSGDRKRCSVVCRRWLRVEGENRRRLSLNAEAKLLDFVPSLFNRFDSVTKLALRCNRKSTSINDDALILISLRCKNLERLKLRGCREITEIGMIGLAKNCKSLKKLSCGSCMFGTKGVYAVIEHCKVLEELSVKRLRGVDDDDAVSVHMDLGASSSLKSICLKELVNGHSFAPLIIGSKKLQTLKLIRCVGDWDATLAMVGKMNSGLVEIHLEKVQVSDVGLDGVSKCSKLETLHLVKTPECSDFGLSEVAERCRMLRKLHIDGWRTNRIGDDGLISVAKHCSNLQELVLIAMYPTSLSLSAIASGCQGLERFALCGIGTVSDADIECIAAKCMALKKLCIKACPVTNVGIAAFASGCPNLVKLKVRKCRKVTGEVVEWLNERRNSLVFNFDYSEVEALDGSGSDGGAQESTIAFPVLDTHVALVDDAPSSSSNNNNNRLSMFRTKFGFLAGRNFVPCAFRRWANIDNPSDSSFS
ncbi:Leucine-rich repeat, cysteine-containing subtype [Sesbania bispinosa]|nr:Leucine-rich repeat, cysteine-containing subtype [Sesbania bispinosa]